MSVAGTAPGTRPGMAWPTWAMFMPLICFMIWSLASASPTDSWGFSFITTVSERPCGSWGSSSSDFLRRLCSSSGFSTGMPPRPPFSRRRRRSRESSESEELEVSSRRLATPQPEMFFVCASASRCLASRAARRCAGFMDAKEGSLGLVVGASTDLPNAASTAGDVMPAMPPNSPPPPGPRPCTAAACVAWKARSAAAGSATPAGGKGVGWLDCEKSRGCMAFSTRMDWPQTIVPCIATAASAAPASTKSTKP
mmetsp:Transcript_24896/g.74694  ORF Transcript_24896/g.74694 Transcript_24896/m.74694 type:complete len:253 (-) Transcript_24896:546-1304(-)